MRAFLAPSELGGICSTVFYSRSASSLRSLAHEQANSQFFFERVRKVADARLRVPKLARGLLEAARSRRLQERFVFLVSHQLF